MTPGIPNVFGARYVLNMWFPTVASLDTNSSSNATSNSSSAGQSQRFLLLPANATAAGGSSNSSGGAGASLLEPRQEVDSDSTVTMVQPLREFQAIVAIEPRRFFANISATNDYSFLETPETPGQQSGSGGGSNSTGLVRRKREPNPRMPAYIMGQLAWGSPPVGGKLVSQVVR